MMIRLRVIWIVVMMWPALGYGASPYQPLPAGEVLEPWRWRSFAELQGQGLLCMTEGSDGTLYFGTDEGVKSYNGTSWTTFAFEDAPIHTLCAGSAGGIYAGTEMGIHQFENGQWRRVFPQDDLPWPVYDLTIAKNGHLWAGTAWGALVWDGSDWLLHTTDTIASAVVKLAPSLGIKRVPDEVGFSRWWTSGDAGAGAMMVGGYPAPHRADRPMVIYKLLEGGPAQQAGLQVGDRIVAINGRERVTTSGLNGREGSVLQVRVWRQGQTIDVDLTLAKIDGGVPELQVYDVFEAQDGAMWLVLAWGQAIRLDLDGSLTGYGQDEGVDTGIRPRMTQGLDGHIWLVSDDGRRSVNRFDGQSWSQIRLGDQGGVNWNPSVLTTRDGCVWVGGRLGVLHVLHDETWTIFERSDVIPIPSTRVVQMHEASDGAIWIVAKGQDALRIDYGTDRWTTYVDLHFQCEDPSGATWFLTKDHKVVRRDGSRWTQFDSSDGLMSHATTVIADQSGMVWAAGGQDSTAATAQFDANNKTWKRELHNELSWRIHGNAATVSSDGSLWFGAESGWSSSRGQQGGVLQRVGTRWIHHKPPEALRYVYGIAQGRDGTLWFGGQQLKRFGLTTGWDAVLEPEHLTSYVHSVAGNSDLGIWIGTRAYGIYHFDGEKWRQHDVQHGVIDNSINGLLVDRDGGVWAGTEQGISHYDGRQWVSLALPKALRVHFGHNLRQSSDGAFWVNLPDFRTVRYMQDKKPPETHMIFAQEEVSQPGNAILKWAGTDLWHTTPDHELTFSYRLNGGGWSPFTRELSTTLLEQASGEHVFEVKARDRDLNEDPTPAQVAFVVLPPIWQQPWFVGLVGFLVAIIVVQTRRAVQRGQRLREANETLEHRVSERTEELANTVEDLEREMGERQRAEEANNELRSQLHQSQKMEALGRLASGVAHDFNNILTVVIVNAELLQLREYSAEEINDKMQQSLSASERGVALTRQLLAFSKQQVFEPEVLDLNAQIQNVQRLLERLIGEPVALRTILDDDLGRIKADPGQIDQVVINLAVNARDAMPDGGRLTLETHNVRIDDEQSKIPSGDYVMLLVHDVGTGMDDETLERIFEPFFTTKEAGKGTGLGLATVHGIVSQSGGVIEVESQLGKGTTFKIYLPLIEGEVTVRSLERQVQEDLHGSETILIVEDEDDVRDLVGQLLEHHGYTTLEASNSGEALLICERHEGDIDLMVADVVMPQMSGTELAKRLAPLRPNMRVLFMSGYLDEAISEYGLMEESTAFLLKPFNRRVLLEKVREVLEEDLNS